jgi:hypothetical protein
MIYSFIRLFYEEKFEGRDIETQMYHIHMTEEILLFFYVESKDRKKRLVNPLSFY